MKVATIRESSSKKFGTLENGEVCHILHDTVLYMKIYTSIGYNYNFDKHYDCVDIKTGQLMHMGKEAEVVVVNGIFNPE